MSTALTITRPSEHCSVTAKRPLISWTIDHRKPESLRYTVRIVALKDGQKAQDALRRGDDRVSATVDGQLSLKFPREAASLRHGAYAAEVRAFDPDGREIAVSEPRLLYVEPDNLPVSLSDLLCCDDLLSQKWRKAYGSPGIQPNADGSLPHKTTILTLAGSQSSGDAAWNTVDGGFRMGKRYAIRLSSRMLKDVRGVRLRVMVFNGSLPSSGRHPQTNPDIAVIAETGELSGDTWNRILLPSWRATKDYENIAVTVFSDSDRQTGSVEVADVCVGVTDHCGPVATILDSGGKPDIPDDWKDFVDRRSKPQTVDVNFVPGSMADLYGPMFDGLGNSNWYRRDECASLGGRIPPEASELQEEFAEATIAGLSAKDIRDALVAVADKFPHGDLNHLTPIEGDNGVACSPPRLDRALPFEGRDIVYVHGFSPAQVMQGVTDTMNGVDSSVLKVWPTDEAEFEDGGFFRNAAENYWRTHVNDYLSTPAGLSNRYLAAAYSSNQRLIECAHALLGQISKAMNSGEGVHESVSVPNRDCFGRDLVIVSHSTGALVVNAAMALAARTANDPQLQSLFGDVSHSPERVKVHISLHGAIAGSEAAELVVVGANLLAGFAISSDIAVDLGIAIANVDPALSLIRSGLTGFGLNVPAIEAALDSATDSLVSFAAAGVSVVNGSVLVDLSPPITKLLWGSSTNSTPVPVLTVAGGHPTPSSAFLKPFLAGLDDGVVNINSQSGSPSLLHPDQYLFFPPVSRIFDMGIPLDRAIVNFAEQAVAPLSAAYGSIPQLSPTGMLQPVDVVVSPSPRYQNHFTFLQSSSDHNHPFQAPTSAYQFTPFGNPNFEETLVIERPDVFDLGLVNPEIAQAVVARTRGQDLVITLNIPVPVFSFVPPSVSITTLTVTVTIPLWRRNYRTLESDQATQECDYVYRFVLR
ncbi:MAG: hypothetical protein R3C19_14010 [Planctomycetaceae bacterium]